MLDVSLAHLTSPAKSGAGLSARTSVILGVNRVKIGTGKGALAL